MSTSLESNTLRIVDKMRLKRPSGCRQLVLSCNQLINQDDRRRGRTDRAWVLCKSEELYNHCSHLTPWATSWYWRTFPSVASTCILLVLDGALSRGFKSLLRGQRTFSSSPSIWIFQSTRGVHKHARDAVAKVDLTVRSNGLVPFELQIFRGQFVLWEANKSTGIRTLWCNTHLSLS